MMQTWGPLDPRWVYNCELLCNWAAEKISKKDREVKSDLYTCVHKEGLVDANGYSAHLEYEFLHYKSLETLIFIVKKEKDWMPGDPTNLKMMEQP